MSGRTPAAKLRLAAIPLGVVIAAAACGTSGGGAAPAQPSSHPPSSSATRSPASTAPGTTAPGTKTAPPPGAQAPSCVNRLYSAMTDKQRVGQLFMSSVNSSGASSSDLNTLRRDDVGSAFLMGHTNSGINGVRGVTAQLQSLSPTIGGVRVGMLVSTDQEGGQVQVLNGPGFSAIPSAVVQGGWSPAQLQQNAAVWGRQLRDAGVNLDLAPVVDIVPRALIPVNAPIGKLDREYGNDPQTVARQSSAFVRGLSQAGVDTTLKHFPSLGEVRGDTDFTANVVDNVTTRDGTFLVAYRSGIDAGAQFVMASLASYSRIDPGHISAFSSVLKEDILRHTLGFKGVVISDDLGKAVAVKAVPPGQRALNFLTTGGDMVLTVQPSTVDAMTSAVLAKLPKDAALRADVDASVHRVLTAKFNAGLLRCAG